MPQKARSLACNKARRTGITLFRPTQDGIPNPDTKTNNRCTSTDILQAAVHPCQSQSASLPCRSPTLTHPDPHKFPLPALPALSHHSLPPLDPAALSDPLLLRTRPCPTHSSIHAFWLCCFCSYVNDAMLLLLLLLFPVLLLLPLLPPPGPAPDVYRCQQPAAGERQQCHVPEEAHDVNDGAHVRHAGLHGTHGGQREQQRGCGGGRGRRNNFRWG